MKFTVSMKCPDALHEAIEEAVKKSLPDIGMDDDERDAVAEKRYEKTKDLCVKQWFQYGEYIDVEVDTDAMTCTVVPNK
jgi:hypothetical protein